MNKELKMILNENSEKYFELFEVKFIAWDSPKAGGCNKNNEANNKINHKNLNYYMMSPKSVNSNCLIACFKRFLNCKEKADKIKKAESALKRLSDKIEAGKAIK